jgi:hypothetical protein
VNGIESVVLEDGGREYVEQRIRVGVLEQGTVDLLRDAGVGGRMDREGIVHNSINLQFEGERHHVPLTELSGGKSIVIYGQTEIVKDLVGARLASGCRCCSRSRTSPSTRSNPSGRASISRRTASRTSSSATSSPAATASTVCAVRAFRQAR